MTTKSSEAQASHKAAFIVAMVILLMAGAVLITAYGYSGGSGIFPRFIGWIFLGLVLLELAIQTIGLLRPSIRCGAGKTDCQPGVDKAVILKEIQGVLWIGLFLLALYLAGFLISIPLYMFAFLRFSAKRTLKECLIMSVGATLFVYVLFIELMDYRLYSGVLFGG
jgi:hypothetical protein